MEITSILGQTPFNVPVSGKIRSGIQVPTLSALNTKHGEQIAEMYRRGAAKEYKFKYIGDMIKRQFKLDRYPLRPINTQEFHARACDFETRPELPRELLEAYGTMTANDDGTEELKLLRFPIILPTNNWLMCLPHALKTWSQSRLEYWSEFNEQNERLCMTKGSLAQNERSRRYVRPFGGMPTINRPNTDDYKQDGYCVPESCPQYQKSLCNLSAELLFEIPGLPNASGIVALPTTSFYAMSQMNAEMQLVKTAIGHINGYHNDKPIFWLTKKKEPVSMINLDTGKQERSEHYIIKLEHQVNLVRNLSQADGAPKLAAPDEHHVEAAPDSDSDSVGHVDLDIPPPSPDDYIDQE